MRRLRRKTVERIHVLAMREQASGSRCPMRRLLACLAAATFMLLPLGRITAAPARNQEMKALRKQHKEQRKVLKEQQRAMKKVMEQHDLPSESQQRFRNNMKMQRQEMHRRQRDETRRLKQRHKSEQQARSMN